VGLVPILQTAFAAAAVVAALSLLGATFDRVPRRYLVGLAFLLGAVSLAAWVAFGLRPSTSAAVAAAGITLAFVAEIAAIKMRRLLRGAHRVDEQLSRAQARLNSLVAREADERNAELERVLARARADSLSLLAEQERRIAEERRTAAAERSRTAADDLGQALIAAQQQVAAKLSGWRDDLERAQRAVVDQLAHLAQRQKQLISDAEARIAADAERLEAESEQQRAGLVRLRDELARATQEAVEGGAGELEAYASERRRALHELNERIRRRERQLSELIEREETDAVRRIQATFADVERRQVEQLERILNRATSSYSDAATQQFADAIKAARENAGTRLSRELDRAVQAFAREAEKVLAERLTQVGYTGAQRLEKRLAQVTEGLERQRTEAIAEFEGRLTQAEQELRRRLDGLAAAAEAERAVLEARLRELARRIDETLART
jgi:DNA repair exonuclease SbcCD ATPase subunit